MGGHTESTRLVPCCCSGCFSSPRHSLSSHPLLTLFSPPPPTHPPLSLLPSHPQDMEDAELAAYVLQLVQVLKYEARHDSALARFLLRRSLRSPHQVGHTFFWCLKAEMHVPEVSERFGLLLQVGFGLLLLASLAVGSRFHGRAPRLAC